jgi:hypothetical protein
MATITIEAFVTYEKWDWEDKPSYRIHADDMSTCGTAYVTIRKQAFMVEIPDDFDPRPLQIQALRKEKSKVLAEAEAKATNIEEQIQRLLCLEAPKA